ncbi:alpha-1,3-glucan synthase [Blastomyces gilchristii SLH14081]|uniref:alpha-1,3-glucan synthase n=1 Tax=Blastomyces gilchristii (strain SLH14081) TaxID=559298 RepID=A0A179U892_BLAGS|nr:alpha-1,3-glucan synthase [Blastomyces gilchristii SLH14081]OAT03943.1 alpha-1,3-glucan synthase [Blastomyces gilchristii SLH14081]
MMRRWLVGVSLALLATGATSWPYDPEFEGYNLNENKTATNPADYYGEWENHEYFPSPENWRFPFYSLFLDRFVNGDPRNDNINGTFFEHDLNSNQMRHGGDISGLVDTLDYLQGMGIKGIYLAGTILMNAPSGADGYSVLDTTLLDRHYGNIQEFRYAITEIHKRGMYVLMDNTLATMGDLIGFKGYLNTTTPFDVNEHEAVWKTNRRYVDFDIGNNYNETCDYPRFYWENGYPVGNDVTDQLKGCYDSDFDQYGDIEAFGVYPDWQRQLAKFASVQDRLREWVPSVRQRLMRHSCLIIRQLDIDGFRYDKALQATVDAFADISEHYRECAKSVGKHNFFLPGEITGGNTLGSIYIGRGRQPNMLPETLEDAVKLTNTSSEKYFIREPGKSALDAGAFHYSIYRSLTRFLGMDGNLAAGYDTPVNWVDTWYEFLLTNDFVNANGKFDPRHMFGATNQDVFRWPTIREGTERMLLAFYITTLHLPGIPLLLWGEEQAFYVLDNTARNYIFGRQAMSPATAWQTHGCYSLGSEQYYQWPIESGKYACHDETVSYDHRDPSHPVRNVLKTMYQMREHYPTLNDGWFVQHLSNQTWQVFLPGSNNTPTETGMWSIHRSRFEAVQDFGREGNLPVWLVYQNYNKTHKYEFDCSDNDTALISSFDSGTTVKNLFYPFDELTLKEGPKKLGFDQSAEFNGCLDSLELKPWDFRAYVPKDRFIRPRPMVTKFVPGHDARLQSTVSPDQDETVPIELYYSEAMSCDGVTRSITFNSTTDNGKKPSIDASSVKCTTVTPEPPKYIGEVPHSWKWSANLVGVYNGVHRVTISNAPSNDGLTNTTSVDHFLFRIGQPDNPMVFTRAANYSSNLLHKDNKGNLYVTHHAAGADLYRYSLTWGSSFSDWLPYEGGNTTLERQHWSGTKLQRWEGEHVSIEYWNRMTGSSSHVQHGDLDWPSSKPRRFPHLFWNGPYNQYGYDAGLKNHMVQDDDGIWKFIFMTEWPALAQVNVWGINPDGKPDQTFVFGDIDGDSVLDRLPPSSLAKTIINITQPPPAPHLAWLFSLNDGTLRFQLHPVGNHYHQLILYILLWVIPILTSAIGIYVFMKSFYRVKFNQVGISDKGGFVPLAIRRKFRRQALEESHTMKPLMKLANKSKFVQSTSALVDHSGKRRTTLIATLEYYIPDWKIKIKIGGLGVMAQLMGENLGHQDLIWVIPCVGGVDYPVDQVAEPMTVTILGNAYEVKVQYHILNNITYVLLDAPVFRQQSTAEPYPARMDDLDSAIYYSAWNQCIALAIRRFPVDLYHINDYHGSAAPLYLLPQTIPACLSLHNAEFQGLWPMRTQTEKEEVCAVFNLPLDVASRYVQFGEVFNLLHAGASYLRVHQQGFGAVGVSRKYGKRSYARYPIFWGLKKVGNLPNPDPSDTGEWNKQLPKDSDITVDPEFEAKRAELKRQAQEWAGLDQNPDADLLVFVGRWSMQKGVDLIADVFPAVLEARENVQLICIGPVIDLYGKFAALKLEKMMKLYPGRVFSRPEFTALPPYIFSGAEFALIPSRDEPFGLVAVEFGRKGALGIGARVGGLGQMPGWWYTVESTTTSHLLNQFKLAIDSALNSKPEVRAMMRARSATQRFPVAQWVEDLEILQSTAIRIHNKESAKSTGQPHTPSGYNTPGIPGSPLGPGSMSPATPGSRNHSYAAGHRLSAFGPQARNTVIYHQDSSPGPDTDNEIPAGLSRNLSLGVRSGPGHMGGESHVPRKLRKNNAPVGVPENEPENEPEPVGVAVTADIDEESDDDTAAHYFGDDDEYTLTREQAEAGRGNQLGLLSRNFHNADFNEQRTPGTSRPPSPSSADGFLPPSRPLPYSGNFPSSTSVLSLGSVVGSKKDFKLQKVDPFFTDSNGEFYRAFEKKLEDLNSENSETDLCIEGYLVKSEKKWFNRFRNARLGRNTNSDNPPSLFRAKRGSGVSPAPSEYGEDLESRASDYGKDGDEFLLGNDYIPPTGLEKWMQLRIGDWPAYSFFLAFGQIIAANSYQITLLTGEVGQSATKLYAIATTYLITSIIWWFIFRWFKSVIPLSLPFFFYGLAFMFIGVARFAGTENGVGWIRNIGSGLYATASSSGSIFFALNFGDESGAPVKDWVFRACVIQGTQQIYVVALWYWGSTLTKNIAEGVIEADPIASSWKLTAIAIPIGLFLWTIGLLLFFGLPNYYRQTPGKVPSFYKSLFRRKIVIWFFVTVVVQNFFLSAPYGRNWAFLWSSKHAKPWHIVLLILLFFIVVWAVLLAVLGYLSKDHSWILPLFAIGLGAPRWAQIWWGTSGIGQHVPWAGGYISGALISRSLWLWLGVLDAMQGVGFGMILLQTLTRLHICFTLLAAQVLGSIATICARTFAPNKIGPGDIHPDISGGISAIENAWFWICLFCQLAICAGFYLFFRKEQLSKP